MTFQPMFMNTNLPIAIRTDSITPFDPFDHHDALWFPSRGVQEINSE